jgi:rare lipoprotein A
LKDRSIRRSPSGSLIRACLSSVAGAVFLSACSTSEPQRVVATAKPASKEYFAEAEYGVKASPRVTAMRTRLPRGGGRDQIGKPYKIKGKWYHPKEEPNYRKSGMASWYGDAFHGRLTANGEIYDMTHLTAAHPTMPLPSYARVTNKKNGASVVVRVNDRGPYAHGRIVDLSRRAAELLDYTHSGIAQVEVEYMGRAPLDGHDDAFLMASYRPGNVAPDPSDGLPGGVMIAMNGATPTTPVGASFFGIRRSSPAATTSAAGDPVLPALGPIAPERPGRGLAGRNDRLPALAYTTKDDNAAARVLDRLAAGASTDVAAPATVPYVAVGTFSSREAAQSLVHALDRAGRAVVNADGDAFVVSLHGDGRSDTDAMLRAAWAAGATDALIVRE